MHKDENDAAPECALFDMDNCLLAYSKDLRIFESPGANLTPIQIEGFPLKHYFINLLIIAEIFKQLQKKGIIIGFATAALCYKPTVIRKFFEQILDLEQDSLKNAPFISGYSFGDPFVLKVEKIIAAKNKGLLPKNCKVTLIDDDVLQIHGMRRLENDSFEGIIAHGLPNRANIGGIDVPIDNRYLQDIINKWDLDIKLPDDLVRSERSLYTPLLQARLQTQQGPGWQIEDQQAGSDAVACLLCCARFLFCCPS